MPAVSFSKVHGLGNDFVLLEGDLGLITPAAAVRLCDRRRGIGADGVLTLLPARTPAAERRMHVYNADGSVAEMCGNGLRCVVAQLAGRAGARVIQIDTDAGLRAGSKTGEHKARVELGPVSLLDERVEVELGEQRSLGMGLSVGNPHLVLEPFPADADLMALATRFGPALERHPRFPERVNVGFLKRTGPSSFDLVVFERGAGITQACGTGAGAAAVAAVRRGWVKAPVDVTLPGGPLCVVLEGDPTRAGPGGALAQVTIEGEAVSVFSGQLWLEPSELLSGGA